MIKEALDNLRRDLANLKAELADRDTRLAALEARLAAMPPVRRVASPSGRIALSEFDERADAVLDRFELHLRRRGMPTRSLNCWCGARPW